MFLLTVEDTCPGYTHRAAIRGRQTEFTREQVTNGAYRTNKRVTRRPRRIYLRQNTYPREGNICSLSLPDILARPVYRADRNGIDQLTRATGSSDCRVPSDALFQWRVHQTNTKWHNGFRRISVDLTDDELTESPITILHYGTCRLIINNKINNRVYVGRIDNNFKYRDHKNLES